MLDQAAPILELAGDLISRFLGSNSELQDRLKMQMGQQIAGADFQTNMSPEMYQAIVVDRNQIVMDVLATERAAHPEKQSIAIFYGAGHMEDFVERFGALGYTQSNQRWMTAWRIGSGAPEASENTPEFAPESETPEAPAPR